MKSRRFASIQNVEHCRWWNRAFCQHQHIYFVLACQVGEGLFERLSIEIPK
jgi:hypothetical protein